MFYTEDNTENEQEDLPYDGFLQNRCQTSYELQNLEEFLSVENATQSMLPSHMSGQTKENVDYKIELPQRKINLSLLPLQNDQTFTTREDDLLSWKFNNSGRNEDSSHSKIPGVLLHHFPKENLTSSCQLIDSETIPEISFNDSFDETVLSKSKNSENARIFSPEEKIKNNMGRQINSDSVVKNWDMIQNKPFSIVDCADSIYNSSHHEEDNPQFDQKERATNEECQKKQNFLENTGSRHVPKCGQHQIHYRFPDSSVVTPKMLPCSESHRPDLSIQAHPTGISSKTFTFSSLSVPVKPMLGFPQPPFSELQATKIASSLPSADAERQSSANRLLQNVTDDEEQMLKEQTEELKAKVAVFSKSVKQDVFSVQGHLPFLQLLKDQLDQLERNYLAAKKKHYALQLQNHHHLSTYIEEFDPNRKVEGEIFKLGTLLEAIKEKIDKPFSPDSTGHVTSPSFVSYESGSPSYSSYSESPLTTSVSESPKKNIAVKFPKNEKHGKNRNHSVKVISQKTYKIPNQGEKTHPFQQKENQNIPKTYYSRKRDTNIGLSQNLSGWNTSVRQSKKRNLRNRHTEDKDTMILNSTLDQIILTANNLKKTTEHIMQTVSKDLAKVKIQTFSSGTAHHY